jgi:preprotein translocase subunit SecE
MLIPPRPPERGDPGERARRSRNEDDDMSDKLRWDKRLGNFLKEVRAELKKVTWPSRNEVYSTTIVVIAATIFFGFYLFFMDVIFSWVIGQIKSLFG